MTDRKKIIETIRTSGYGYFITHDNADVEEVLAQTADTLIAAGIGDVSEYKEKLKLHRVFVRKDGGDIKVLYGNNEVDEIVKERNEYKHRAEVAERALKKFAENITCEDCPFFSDCASSEKMEDLIHSNYCFAEYLQQAEKELAEEGKDEQNYDEH